MSNIHLLVSSLNYIETHLQDPLRTSEIADAVFCAKSTLEKMFQYLYSISVHEYVTRWKMMLAARLLTTQPHASILSVAVECGYNSHEVFTRAFKKVWNCNPSEFRSQKYLELFPMLREPVQKGDLYIMQRRSFDISQLYDLFCQRKDCCLVCCDISEMIAINEISRKAGDIAILESMRRMEAAAGDEDLVFRIGGDEFCMLTNERSLDRAQRIADEIIRHNGDPISFEGRQIPLSLHTTVTQLNMPQIKYDELFTRLHLAIRECKH